MKNINIYNRNSKSSVNLHEGFSKNFGINIAK